MEGNLYTCDHDVGPCPERSFQDGIEVVVQEQVPRLFGYRHRDEHHDLLLLALAQVVDERHHRPDYRCVLGAQDSERDTGPPPYPVLLQRPGSVRFRRARAGIIRAISPGVLRSEVGGIVAICCRLPLVHRASGFGASGGPRALFLLRPRLQRRRHPP